MSNANLLGLAQLWYEPGKTMETVRSAPRPWTPLILLTILSTAVIWWYFSTVDFDWLLAHMLAARPDAKPEMRAAMAKVMKPGTMTGIAVAGALLTTPLIVTLYAAYFHLTTKLVGATRSFGAWFGFSAWVIAPRLLVLPLMAAQILTSNGRIGAEELNLASFNSLFVHLPPANPWTGLLCSLDLASLWIVFLSWVGLRKWTGASPSACAALAISPPIIVYGLWALKIIVLS